MDSSDKLAFTFSNKGELVAPSSADMDVGNDTMDVEDALLQDHEAPTEKTDADFFNGAPCRSSHRSLAARTLEADSCRLHRAADFDDDFDDEDLK